LNVSCQQADCFQNKNDGQERLLLLSLFYQAVRPISPRVELHVSSCSSLIFSEDLRTVSKREVIFILMIYLYFDVIDNPFILTWCRSDFTEKIKFNLMWLSLILILVTLVTLCSSNASGMS